MPEANVRIEGRGVVLRGSFNPMIFQPEWLRSQGLVDEAEFELPQESKSLLVSHEFTNVTTSWFTCQIRPDVFQVMTQDTEMFGPLRDLVSDILDRLPHTPIAAIGINTHFHFDMESRDRWDSVGTILVPRSNWDTVLSKPGMRGVAIEAQRTDERIGSINVRVEPSVSIPTGVFVEINDHVQFKESEPGKLPEAPEDGAQRAVEVLKDNWDNSYLLAHEVIDHIVELVDDAS